jgi:hypothetical protein
MFGVVSLGLKIWYWQGSLLSSILSWLILSVNSEGQLIESINLSAAFWGQLIQLINFEWMSVEKARRKIMVSYYGY